MQLIVPIKDKGYTLIDNLGRIINTANLNLNLYNVPIWKHIYHALYWFDYWVAGPKKFIGTEFHVENLDSIDVNCDCNISREQLMLYFESVSNKSKNYLGSLTDDMLTEQPYIPTEYA